MQKFAFVIIAALAILLSECDKSSDRTFNSQVNQIIIVDNDLFVNAAADNFEFTNAEIVSDSLKITFRYGGGCGSVEIKLIDSGAILESYPVQRNIRLSFKDEDLCEALLTKVISFDLKPIRVSNEHQVILNLTGWDYPLLYTY